MGWDHHINRKRIGIIGTSVGLLSIDNDSEHINSAITTIENSQNKDGGWSTKTVSIGGAISLTESTCYCLLALMKFQERTKPSIIKAGADFIVQSQLVSGGWGTTKKSDAARTIPSCLSIQIMNKDKDYKNSMQFKIATTWLVEAQNHDGGWGVYYKDNNSTPSHTANCISTLIDIGYSTNNPIIRNAVSWLLSDFDLKETWQDNSEFEHVFFSDENSMRFEFKHASLPLALCAILKGGHSLFEEISLIALSKVIAEQADAGYWLHSMTPGHIPIWATYSYINALSYIKNNIFIQTNNFLIQKTKKTNELEIIQQIFSFSNQNTELFETVDVINENEDSLIDIVIEENKSFVKSLKEDISNNRIEIPIKNLIEYFKNNKDILNQLILLSARYSKIKLEESLNISAKEDVNIENSKIGNSLLKLIDNEIHIQSK